jgi:hypothetical protein
MRRRWKNRIKIYPACSYLQPPAGSTDLIDRQMSVAKNIRRHRRIPHLKPIKISWEEHGQQRFAVGKCTDISEAGMRIESPHPIQPFTTIQIGAERLKFSGAATVKHITRSGGKYLLGVELTQFILGDDLAELEGRPAVTVLIENFNKLHQKV